MVRRNAEQQAQQHLEQDTRQAILTFQVVQQQQRMALSRKADLLAFLALMRNGDATTIEDAGNDPWQSEDFNLFVLADKSGKIKAIHSTASAFPDTAAQEMIWRSLGRGETTGWWSGGKNLYQVVLQPFYEDESRKTNLQGYVVVGRSIDEQAARDLGKIASSDIVFRSGTDGGISTLPPLKEADLEKQIHNNFATTKVELDGEQYYLNAVDLAPGMNPGTTLIVLKSYNEVAAYLKRLNHLLLGLGLVTMFAGGALIFVISDTITRPVADLMQGVQALEMGDFTYSLEATGNDEVSKLTRAFESMRGSLRSNQAQREEIEAQLRQSQKMEALGRLAGGVAHDFNNLLTVIMGHSELLLDHLRPGDALHKSSEQIRKTADRAASLTRQMLAFSRMQVIQAKDLDMNDLVMESESLLRRLIREDIEFSFRLSQSIGRVKADAGQLEQVLLNLTVNASDAMPLGGKLTIETQAVEFDKSDPRTHPPIEPGKYVLLSVTDTGHGMDTQTKARIFEPFFTTKELGKGTGLGLATVYGVVKQTGGYIWVESEPGSGTRFEIYLPRFEERVEETFTEKTRKCATPSGGRKTILVVEDERELRELACGFLTSAGYNVFSAQDGSEALELAKRLGESIHAVLTDMVMPKMRGQELIARLKDLLPHVKVVYMTGYLEQNEDRDRLLEDALFLQKPFSREAVVNQVGRALNSERSEMFEVETAVI